MKNAPEYDVMKKNRAVLHGTLRGVVCVYLACLAWHIMQGPSPASPMPGWAAYSIAAIFLAAAGGFGIYTWKQYKKDLRGALLPSEPGEADTDRKA